jgi:flagellar secretion chaperone FliS
MFASPRSQASAYSNVHVDTGVQSADPHQLVMMLLDGALDAIATARGAIEQRNVSVKCRAINRATGIVDEGLRGALDMQRGGEVAQTLHDLYSCVLMRLTLAHAKNDVTLLRECSELLTPLRDAWLAARPQMQAA